VQAKEFAEEAEKSWFQMKEAVDSALNKA